MAFQPVPNTLQVQVVYQAGGQIVENVVHFEKASPSLTDIESLTEALNAYLRSNFLPLLANTIQLIRLVSTMLDAVDGLLYVSTTSLPAAGAHTSDGDLPNNNALCLTLTTGNRGRSARGRSFICGMADLRVTKNELDGDYVSDIANAWMNFLLVGVDDGWVPVVVSRVTGGAPRTSGVTYQITGCVAQDNVIDSQRRRLPGRGS